MFCFSLSGVWFFTAVQYKIQYEVASVVLGIFLNCFRSRKVRPFAVSVAPPSAPSQDLPRIAATSRLRTQNGVYGLLPPVFHHRVRNSTRLLLAHRYASLSMSVSLFLVGQTFFFHFLFQDGRVVEYASSLIKIPAVRWFSCCRNTSNFLCRHMSRKVRVARIPESSIC